MNRLGTFIVNFFQFLSVGKINTGLTFNRKRYYSTLLGGIISLAGLIFLLVFVFEALIDCFSRKYYDSEVD